MLVRSGVSWLGWWDMIQSGGLEVFHAWPGGKEGLRRSLKVEHLAGRLVLQGRAIAQILLGVLLSGFMPRWRRLALQS